MTAPVDLVPVLLAAVPPDERDAIAALPGVADQLTALVDEARAAWPELALDAGELIRHVATRLPAGAAAAALVAGPRAGDLAIAWACTRGDAAAREAAIAACQHRYFGEIDIAGRRTRSSDELIADARQNIARTVFTGDHPAIAGYTGRGDLRGWIRMIATRELLRLQALARREVHLSDDDMLDALSPAADPELAYLQERYRREFAEAFHAAVATLSDRERALFRHQLVDGWGIDELGAHYGVHRSTAARWLTAARDRLLAHTRDRLKLRWGGDSLEIDSVIRLLTSRLDVSLERAFKT
jgi:RNA polymerase sigma-70 factor (ECF subfamily)